MRLFFLLIFCSYITTKPTFANIYSLEQLLKIAEENSAIKSAELSVAAQQRFANQQLYWENPQISINRSSKQSDYNLSQSIPYLGKLQTRFNIEETQAKIYEMRKNNLALLIKSELFGLIYQYQTLQKKIELAELRIKRLSLIDRYLSSIVLSSPTQKAQARITKDRIKLISRDLFQLKNQLYLVWRQANTYLSLNESEPEIHAAWLDGKIIGDKSKLIEFALDKNFSIKEQQFLLKKYAAELAFARIERMPDVNVLLSRKNSDLGASSSNENAVGISLTVPLFNRNQEKILGAGSQIKAQEYELEFQKNALFNSILGEINRFETAVKIAENFHFNDYSNKLPLSTKLKNQQKSKNFMGKITAQKSDDKQDLTKLDEEFAGKIEFNTHSHLNDYIKSIVSRLNRANDDFKKGILEFITYIELDSQEYAMIDTALDNQVELAFSYGNLCLKLGEFQMPKSSK